MRARLRRHLDTMVVAGIVATLVAGAPAVAGPLVDFARHAGNADRVDGLNASRTPRAGQLLALDGRKKFPASVVPAGATGPIGPAGPVGATGATGGPGAKGDTGSAGAAGARGLQGEMGLQGIQGLQGLQGLQGAQGAKGDTGDTGDPGAAGANGAPGADGAPGAKGDKGDPGATGAKGDKGDTGDTGPAGSAAAYPPIVDINPILRPSRSNLWDRVQINGNAWFNGYRSSFPSGTDASYLEWDLPLQAGTWTIDVVYVKSHDAGILSLSLGGSALAPEIDAFRPAADGIDYNLVATFTGVNVATTGIHSLRIRTASKNPLSDGHFGYLTWIRLVRE